ncbi:glycoside hydrolase family 3 N-terminal domain-containing protein [Naasia sp. SYSU D00057]|uniref:beta-xylosidase/alpha-l-arabinosidase n=1 Tax=Naasia sp. SYSU D00057 TaxID=2817380 RepID=UPI001B309478|nr:glycoside hydrolase family 3 N-terminal domain-containing protein [Naasia sp. SYSU D00057]
MTTDATVLPERDWTDPARGIDERVEALLAEMTLDEKLAQLGSYWDDRRGSDEVIAPMQDVFSQGRPSFEQATAHGIGHLTRVLGTVPVSAAEGTRKLAAAQEALREHTRLRVPAIAHEECLTGFTTLGATVYPTALAWGATFDPDLVERMAAAIGADMSAVGVHQGLSPVLDVTRDYRWGRVEETIGEDPYAVGMIGAAYVRGLQSAGVIATLKHFAGYSASRGGRNHAPVSVGPRELADVILPPFEMAVRLGGARSVMNSYSEIDGVPAAADRHLLTELLRDGWGFEGTVVSDYWAVPFLKSKHRLAAEVGEAGALALEAGLDVELPDTGAYGRLAPLLEDGRLSLDVVDTAVRRVLRQKAELGLLDAGWSPVQTTDVDLDSAENRAIARRLAEESVILLDNRARILPISAPPASIAVIGPCAEDPGAFLGCYSYPIHVLPRHPQHGFGIPVDSLPSALAAEFPAAQVTASAGCPLRDVDRSGIPAAVEQARGADVVVAVVGDRAGMFGRGTSGEGCDAPDLELPGSQGDLLDALLDTGTPVIVLVVSGRPYALGRYADRAAAVLQAFMPGSEGAGALAGVLSGRVNPSGHLPVQIPAADGALPYTYLAPPLGHDGDRISNVSIAPLYPFGHGLSFTTFEVAELELGAQEVPVDGGLTATVRVGNTGSRAGATVVQLYADDPVASVTRAVRQLVGFARIELDAGESALVEFDLAADRFSFTSRSLERIVEPGEIVLTAGLSSRDAAATESFRLTGKTRVVPEGSRVLETGVRIVR